MFLSFFFFSFLFFFFFFFYNIFIILKCEKQCRDENGFKCHCSSESHQRQMILFADSPDKFINSYSNDFKKEFLNLLSRR